MHDRRIGPGGAVGQTGVSIARLFGHGDQIGHAAQRCILARCRDLYCQSARQINLTRANHSAGTGPDRLAFASQQRPVHLGFAHRDNAIDRHTPTGADDHMIGDAQGRYGHGFLGPIGQADPAWHLKCCQLLCRRPGRRAGADIQIAATEQEECQHHGGVKIRLFAGMERLID